MVTKMVTKMEDNIVSKLASNLASVQPEKPKAPPRASCFPLYGEGDREDLEAVDRLRDANMPWAEIHETVDRLLEIGEDDRINTRRFTRHWKAECSCW